MERRSGTEEATADCTSGEELIAADTLVEAAGVDEVEDDGVDDDLTGEAPEVVTGRDGEAERITDSGAADDINAEMRAEEEAATDRCTCAGFERAGFDRAGLADVDGPCGAADRITAEGRIGREAEPGVDCADCDVGQAEANRAPNS